MPALYNCPKCARPNPETAQFCTSCHAILIRRCQQCWHQQRAGNTCEQCGSNFALNAELAVERTLAEDNRLELAQAKSEALTLLQILLLPFAGAATLLRAAIAILAARSPRR